MNSDIVEVKMDQDHTVGYAYFDSHNFARRRGAHFMSQDSLLSAT